MQIPCYVFSPYASPFSGDCDCDCAATAWVQMIVTDGGMFFGAALAGIALIVVAGEIAVQCYVGNLKVQKPKMSQKLWKISIDDVIVFICMSHSTCFSNLAAQDLRNSFWETCE